MTIGDLPLIAVDNGGSANPDEIGDAVTALEAMAALLECAAATAVVHERTSIDLGVAVATLDLETSMMNASFHQAGHPGIVVRCPRIDGQDATSILSDACAITIATLKASMQDHDMELQRSVIERNDAICAAVAQARGGRRVDGITMRPANPFKPMRITLSCGGESAEWIATPEHAHWAAARHVGFSAYVVPNRSVHIHLDDLTRHSGPDVHDPISVMRLIAGLPPGPPVVIPDHAWEPMF